jgi:hypothetical protein
VFVEVQSDLDAPPVPVSPALALFGTDLAGLAYPSRRKKTHQLSALV